MKSNIVLKAGLWYALSNVLIRASAFLTIPLFTRLMTQEQYGEYSNIASWVTILTIITGWDAYTTVIRSKHDFEEDLDRYISSVYIMNVITTSAVFLLIFAGWSFFSRILMFDFSYLVLIFGYLLVLPAFNLYATKQRAFYKYKVYAVLTVVNTMSSVLLSVALVVSMDDKLTGRIVGQYLPPTVLFVVFAIVLLMHGRGVKRDYIEYAAKLSAPFVPHLLSLNVLSVSSRIIINNVKGSAMAALYSVSFNCVQIANILFDAINKAWAPWFMDAMHDKQYESISKVSSLYFATMLALIVAVLLIGPELILILGGSSYISAKWALPPLIMSCAFQVAYTMYINCEYYYKQTKIVAIATVVAATFNLILNIIFVPIFGFVAASFSSYLGYAVLYFIHYSKIKRFDMVVFDTKRINAALLSTPAIIALSYAAYMCFELRILLIAIVIGILVVFVIKHRATLIRFMQRGRSDE